MSRCSGVGLQGL